MNPQLLSALFGFGGVVFGGVLQSWLNHKQERSRFQRDNKLVAYGQLIQIINAGAVLTEEQKFLATELRCRIPLFASADVVKALIPLYGPTLHFANDDSRKALANAILAMRRDLGQSNEASLSADATDLIFGRKDDE